jgi:opacity protein-like surface antigen
MSRITVVAIVVALSVAHATGALAQAAGAADPALSVELFGGVTAVFPRLEGSVSSTFSPLFLYGVSSSSTAEQTLAVSGRNAAGFEVGGNVFFTPHVGLQVRFEEARAALYGGNSPYVVHLRYVSRPPPSYTLVNNAFDQSYPWPDTTGQWRTMVLSFNPAVRARLGVRVSAEASAGLSYVRLSGSIEPLAFSQYWLGGHSVLFSSLYQLRADASPTNALGFNAGGGGSIAVSSRLALLADFRWLYCARQQVPLAIAQILNPGDITMIQDLETIRRAMAPAPGPLSVNPSRPRLMIGLRVTVAGVRRNSTG